MYNKLVKNWIYNTGYQVLTIVIPLITTPYVSRVLKAEGIGVFSFTNNVALVFTLIANLGIKTYGQREISKARNNDAERSKIFWELVVFRLIAIFFCVIAFGFTILLLSDYRYYLALQGINIIAAIADISWYFQGLEEFKSVIVKNIVVKITGIVLIFSTVESANDLGRYILIYVVTNLLGNIALIWDARRSICKIPIEQLNIRKHIRPNIECFIPVISVQIYSYLDKIMLGILGNDIRENGYYEQARKITDVALRIVVSINSIMFPRVAYLYNQKSDSLKAIYTRVYKFVIMLVLPMSVFMFIGANNFVIWFMGDDFLKTALLLKLSAIIIIPMAIGNLVGTLYLMPLEKQNKASLIYFTSAFANIFLNCLMIPRLRSIGAMIASIIAEIISCSLQMYALYRSECRIKYIGSVWKFIVAALVMITVIEIFRINTVKGIAGTLLLGVCGCFIYLFFLLLLKEDSFRDIGHFLK